MVLFFCSIAIGMTIIPNGAALTYSQPQQRTGVLSVERFDSLAYEQLRAPFVRPDGTTLYECFTSKPGVLVYQDAQGKLTRELVLDETLSEKGWLESLGRATVTLTHPEKFVTPDTWAQDGVGDVDGHVQVLANGFVKAAIAVRRRDALNAIKGGIREISAGYTCEIEWTAGVHPEFGAYDCIQRKRLCNHIAIVPEGRAGSSVRLRADAAQQIITTEGAASTPASTPTKEAIVAISDEDKKGLMDEMDKRMDAKFTSFKSDMGTMIKDAVAAGVKPVEKPADPPKSEEQPKTDAQIHQLAAERSELLALAKVHGVEVKPEQTNAALRKAIVIKAKTDARTDANDDYYKAALDFLPKTDAQGQQAAQESQLPSPYGQLSSLVGPRVDAKGAQAGQAAQIQQAVAPHMLGMSALMNMNTPKS
jgi:uncharacterized protein